MPIMLALCLMLLHTYYAKNYAGIIDSGLTIMHLYKGGQVTKPTIIVKMPGCKLLHIIQVKGFSWPYLIPKILVAYNYSYNAAFDWPRTFL